MTTTPSPSPSPAEGRPNSETQQRRPRLAAGLGLLALAGQGLIAIVVLAMLVVGALAWRLSSGPIDAGFLIPTLEAAMSDEVVNLDIARMQLEWRGFDQPVILVGEDVDITGPEGVAMASLPALEVTLSVRALMEGRLAPSSLSFVRPTFIAERLEEGGLEIVLGPAEYADLMPPTDIIVTLLNSLLAPPGADDTPMSEIERLTLRDGWVDLTDHHSETKWDFDAVSIDLVRDHSGIIGTAQSSVSGPDGLADGWLIADIGYSLATEETELAVRFGGIVPKAVSRLDTALTPLAAIRSGLGGHARTTLAPDGIPDSIEFNLDGDAAVLDIPAVYDAPLSVAGVAAQGVVDLADGRLSLPNIGIDIGGPTINAGLSALVGDDGELDIDLNVRVTDLPLDLLAQYWPSDLEPYAREWVTQNITRGIADEALLVLAMTLQQEGDLADDPAWNLAPDGRGLRELSSEIRFSGAALTYLEDLPPITGLSGIARYRDGVFAVETGGGESVGLSAETGSIEITGFDQRYQTIDINVVASGPLADALDFLSRPRLALTDGLGIEPVDVDGSAIVRLRLAFPLRWLLRMDHVLVAASAEIRDASMRLPGMELGTGGGEGLRISGLDGRLTVDGRQMALSGGGALSGRPFDFSWQSEFRDGATDRLEIQTTIAPDLLATLMPDDGGAGLSWSVDPGGTVPVSASASIGPAGRLTADLDVDIADLSLALPDLGVSKPAGIPGTFAGRVVADQGGLSTIQNMGLSFMGHSFEGSVDFADGEWQRVEVDRLEFEGSRVAGRFERTGGGAITGQLNGAILDVAGLLDEGGAESEAPDATGRLHAFLSDPVGSSEGIDIAFDLDGIVLPDSRLGPTRGRVVRTASSRIFEINGSTAGGLPFAFRIAREGEATRLTGGTDHLGGVLSALGVHDGLMGGSLDFIPTTGPDGAAQSILDIRNVRVVEAPVLARLLAAMSVGGLTDLFSGGGLPFDRIEARLEIINGRIQVTQGTASGGALGLTTRGWIDLGTGTMSLSGDVIPIYGVNEVIRSIPLIGDLATGGTDAVFAFTYTVSGDMDAPQVMVNPLSVLAPGLLRRLFSG